MNEAAQRISSQNINIKAREYLIELLESKNNSPEMAVTITELYKAIM
ncbi:hypothetical protein [Loigolactobacillus coryniformis]|nr:hypothetical protein [Loigolactobacillus coryniformis]